MTMQRKVCFDGGWGETTGSFDSQEEAGYLIGVPGQFPRINAEILRGKARGKNQ